MKTLKNLIFVAFIFAFLVSCEPEDQIINNITTKLNLLVAYTNPNTISYISYPEKTKKYNDIYSELNSINLTSEVTKMVSFYNYHFIFKANEYKIDVLNKTDFKIIQTIDFSAEKKKPIGICFPNVTDAYIIFEKDSSVLLFDIVNFKPARYIVAGKYPTSIAAFGNQIYLTNQIDNTVSVIDSRTHKVEQTINVHEAPTFVDFTPDGAKAVVVSLGGGKLDSTKTKTAALISYIDVNTRLIVKTKELASGALKAVNQIPHSFSLSSKNIGIIAVKDYLFRIETKTGELVSVLTKGTYLSVGYNFKSDELMFLKKDSKGTYLITADPQTGATRATYNLDNNISSILPL